MSLNLDPRQCAMLAEMGVRVWWPTEAVAPASEAATVAPGARQNATSREAASASAASAGGLNHQTSSAAGSAAAQAGVADSRAAAARAPVAAAPPDARPAPDTVRQPAQHRGAALMPGPVARLPLPEGIADMDWPALSAAVAGCQACHQCLGRQSAVFVAPPAGLRCDWLVLGEPPDDAQERAGQPFVDDAGQLLDNMLKAVGVSRCQTTVAAVDALSGAAASAVAQANTQLPATLQTAYLSHVLKCRPARPTAPDAAALAACAHYLRREIALLQPKVILAMGRFAMQVLLSQDHPDGLTLPLGKLRGQVWHYQGVPVVVTYPPAYLLRHGLDKARAWADLCLALDVVQGVTQLV